MTCYDSGNGNTFILGRRYLALERYFHKEIARVQAQWYGQQSVKGNKTSSHIKTYSQIISEKAELGNGLSAQDHKILCKILP